MSEQTREQTLRNTYLLMLNGLKKTKPNIEKDLDYYRTLNYKTLKDRDFFSVVARTVFSTGLDFDIVEKRWREIGRAFAYFDVDKVANYGNKEIKELMNNSKVIRNEQKTKKLIENAKEMRTLIQEHGSFVKYIDSFKETSGLIKDLQKRFWYLGETNVLEFLKEICLPFIKDDLQVRKVFYRLGLTESVKANQEEILKIGKAMAKAVSERPCVVDCVLWNFGRDICNRKPRCEICKLTPYCQYYQTKGNSS